MDKSLYRKLFESNPSPMWIYELGSLRFLAVNDAALAQYGYTEQEFLALTVRDIRPPEDLPAFHRFLESIAPGGVVQSEHWRHRRKDGSLLEVEISSHDIDWDGRAARIVEARDVTARRRAEQRANLLERAIESSSNGVVITDARRPDQPLIYVNAAFERITGYRANEVLGLNCRFLQGPDVSQPELERVRQALAEPRAVDVTLRNYTKQGALIWNQLSIAPVRDERGAVTHFVGVLNDVTERRRYESELAYLASHDPVTGLGRYVMLQEQVEALIARGDGARFALLYVDIDRFHNVNETMGHVIGDAALRVVADRLREGVGDPERVCRLASDEFLALLPGTGEGLDAPALAQRIRAALDAAVEIGPYRLYLTCSIGISAFPENGGSAADLLHAAEAAMARAKRHGRDSVFQFNNEQANELQDRLRLGGRLREAIGNGEMVLHYQPQVSALSGEILGVEALVRWQTPDLGLLPPGRFIRVAEELGLIVELGRWVLNEACRQLRAWSDAGLPIVPVAVNVSALQLHRPTFVQEVQQAIERHGLTAGMLEIELTESAIMENVQRMVDTMVALKRLGVRLALDDFGIGFSSLSYLKRFPLDKLKIDQSFVREVSHSPGDAGIVRAIIAMGHQLQLMVMAEGVETEAQLGYLRRNHCDQLQGMFLSAPLPAADAGRVLQQRLLSLGAFVATAPHQTLLLLDDDQNILNSLSRLLRRDGYQVLLANNQQAAYDLLGRHPVQVIVSDQRMPDGTGTEFLSRVKDLYPDTVRMVLSGYTDLASVTEAINRGAIYKFLTKPWDDNELRARIQEAFRMHAQQLEARMADRKVG